MRIAVVCNELVVAGGLIRFERFGKVALNSGHEVIFVRFGSKPAQRNVEIEVMNFKEAREIDWDATMIPGAGFPPEVIELFSAFKPDNFGLRVQHILNSPVKKAGFLAVNKAFEPHVVVSNNRHWSRDELDGFDADVAEIIEGAVDTDHFARSDAPPSTSGTFMLGGLVNKNPAPLLEAVSAMDGVKLRLYGREAKHPPEVEQMMDDLQAVGKLHLDGVLNEGDLPAFYHSLDCVIHTEPFAGWANLGAEALASSTPLVCTPHGTLAFARHEETALVISEATTEAIAQAVNRLRSDPTLAQKLRENGLKSVASLDWRSYTCQMLDLVERHSLHKALS